MHVFFNQTGSRFSQYSIYYRHCFHFIGFALLIELWNNICFFYTSLFTFGLHWVITAVRGFSLVLVSRGSSSLCCMGFLLRWLLLLQSTVSKFRGFSSCGTWALVACSIWNLPGPGIKLMSPALADGFLSTVPPGKS